MSHHPYRWPENLVLEMEMTGYSTKSDERAPKDSYNRGVRENQKTTEPCDPERAVAVSEIANAMNVQSSSLELLEERLGRLGDELYPVLSARTELNCAEAVEEELSYYSPLGQHVQVHTRTIDELSNKVAYLLDRLGI